MHRTYSRALLSCTAALLISFTTTSHAEVSFNLGIATGPTNIDVNADSIDDGSLGNTATVDERTASISVFGELKANSYVRMEFGLLTTGDAEIDAYSDGSDWWWSGPVNAEYSLTGIKLGAVGTLPIDAAGRINLLAKLGMTHWVSSVALEDRCCVVYDNDSGFSPYGGIGIEFGVSELIALRLQHEAFSAKANSEYFNSHYEFDYAASTLALLFRF